MTPDQIVTLILGILGGGTLGAILNGWWQHRRERNKPAIDAADVVGKLQEVTVAQLNQMQKDVERIRLERDAALRESHEWEKQYELTADRLESAQAFNKVIEARATEAGQMAREWHERAIAAEAEATAARGEVSALRQRVIEEKAGVAALGVELLRSQQTGPLNAVKLTNDKPADQHSG